jgi:hypothetical protein
LQGGSKTGGLWNRRRDRPRRPAAWGGGPHPAAGNRRRSKILAVPERPATASSLSGAAAAAGSGGVSGLGADLRLVATCAAGLEELLDGELAALGIAKRRPERGAVSFRGGWSDCLRANWRLRTANRVLVELGSWPAGDGAALAAGARALVTGVIGVTGVTGRGGPAADGGAPDAGELLAPDRSFAI